MSRSLFARLDGRFGTKKPGIERQRHAQNRLKHFEENFATDRLFAPRTPVRGSPLKVIVVGAGLAGLMSAYTLSASCSVTVFEARDRVGGRVWTQFDSATMRVIEAGAELIGYDHPTWLALARKFELGLTMFTSDETFTALGFELPVFLGGRLLSSNDAQKIHEEMDSALSQMIAQARQISDPYKPWQAPNAALLDDMPVSDWIAKLDCSPLTKIALEAQFANNNGAPTKRQSYLANLTLVAGGALHGKADDYFTQTEAVRCEQGNLTLAIKMAGEIDRSGSQIVLSNPIRHIEIKASTVVAIPVHGAAVEADYIILAIPPSLWPGGNAPKVTINPTIPADCHMSMGTVVKYLSDLDTRFWIGEGLAPSGVSDRLGMTWEGTDNQMRMTDQGVVFTLFAGGHAAQSALDAFDRGGLDGLRTFYLREIQEIYPAYPSQSLSGTRFIPWPRLEWTAAGYSCPAPGEVTRIGPFLNRAFHQRMYFAGEHVCLPFCGYMEGALQSGLMAANAILRRESLI